LIYSSLEAKFKNSVENSNNELSRKWIILNDLKREETKLQNFSVSNKKNGSIMALVRGPEVQKKKQGPLRPALSLSETLKLVCKLSYHKNFFCKVRLQNYYSFPTDELIAVH
jgi:hypothetical protein